MKAKPIEFNAADLVGSAEAFADHLKKGRKLTRRIKMVAPSAHNSGSIRGRSSAEKARAFGSLSESSRVNSPRGVSSN